MGPPLSERPDYALALARSACIGKTGDLTPFVSSEVEKPRTPTRKAQAATAIRGIGASAERNWRALAVQL